MNRNVVLLHDPLNTKSNQIKFYITNLQGGHKSEQKAIRGDKVIYKITFKLQNFNVQQYAQINS